MHVNPISSDQNHSVINNCDSCTGDHEVILKPANPALQKQGFTHWFECPHKAQGGPVLVKYEEPKVEEVAQPDAPAA